MLSTIDHSSNGCYHTISDAGSFAITKRTNTTDDLVHNSSSCKDVKQKKALNICLLEW